MWHGKANALVQCTFTVNKVDIGNYQKNLFINTWLILMILDLFGSYIKGSEYEGHFSLINEACSMLVRSYYPKLKLHFPLE